MTAWRYAKTLATTDPRLIFGEVMGVASFFRGLAVW